MLLIKRAELDAYRENSRIADVRCHDGLIIEIGNDLLPKNNEKIIDAKGSALLPGLHDHHMHLLALAATQASINCGPDHVSNREDLQQVLQNAEGHGWIRAIHYHESIAGDLDRWQLDQLVPDRPLRIQHRSGILWILNSCAIEHLQLENERLDGLERNIQDQVTGRLFRLDQWLRKKIGGSDLPDLAGISAQLSRFGITGITDASPDNDAHTLSLFEATIRQGKIHQRIIMMGNQSLPISRHSMIKQGALKILLDEFQLPDWEMLISAIKETHEKQRPVAFHCATEAQLVFALSALQEAGSFHGDRIEHASLCSDEILPLLKSSGASVVTQPGFLKTRGNQYQNDVPFSQHNWLYRCQEFLQQGITLALSSDAPYGEVNPWKNIHASVKRCNSNGYVFGESEKISTEQALLAYLKDPLDLSRYRSIVIGADADLCLLKKSWAEAQKLMDYDPVYYTICAGRLIYGA